MHDHIDLVERKTGVKVVRLQPPRSFDYWMRTRPIVARIGAMKGHLHRTGNGWPSPMRRWCTREKVGAINLYQKNIPDCVPCIGYGEDEQHRVKTGPQRYPLIEYGVTEPSPTAAASATTGAGCTTSSDACRAGAARCSRCATCGCYASTGPNCGPSCCGWMPRCPSTIQDSKTTAPRATLMHGLRERISR